MEPRKEAQRVREDADETLAYYHFPREHGSFRADQMPLLSVGVRIPLLLVFSLSIVLQSSNRIDQLCFIEKGKDHVQIKRLRAHRAFDGD